MVLQLYADPLTVNCHKVLAALEHMGVEYELVHTDYMKSEHKTSEYLRINPNGTLPSAIVDGVAITESNAIMQYGGDIGAGHAAYPKDLKQRAVVNCWLNWESCAWFKSCYVYFTENVLKMALQSLQPDQDILAAEEKNWLCLANVLNDQLSKTKFLAGDEITIADFAIMAPMHVYELQKFPLDKLPHLQRWIGEVEKVPAWHKTQIAVNKVFGLTNHVRAALNYTKDTDKPIELYFYENEKSSQVQPPGDDTKEVVIHDGWSLKDQFSEDKHGFSIHSYQTKYLQDEWNNDDLMKEKFYPEVAEFVRQTIGASRVLVFDHTIRTKNNDGKKLTDEKQTSQRGPVRLVHCDYTIDSGPRRVRQLLGDEAEDLLSRRVVFINVWKPLAKVEEMPLAMCDNTSSAASDFVTLTLRYRDRIGENYVMRYSPAHKWYYFPGIDETQCLLLKTYDSDTNRARFVGHSAFEDPTSKPDAPYRESVEIRTIAFF